MIALASLRQRWSSLLGTAVTLAVAVGLLTVCGLLFGSAHPVAPDRYAASPVLVRPVPPTDAEAFTEPRPWTLARGDELAGRLAGLAGVADAIPVHRFYAQLVRDGVPQAAEREAYGWSAAPLGGYALSGGSAPVAPGEVALDGAWGLRPGDPVTLLTATGPEPFTVSGTVAGPGIWVSDALARSRTGGVSAIGLRTTGAGDVAAVAAAATALVGGDGVVLHGAARGALEPVADARTRWIGMQVLTALSALGGFVSVFIVASTFAFATRQRHRELGLLRLLGAAPGQVRRMIYGEVLLLGLLGGAAGVPLGVAAAAPLGRWLVRAGYEPASFTVTYPPVVPLAALAAGLLVALAGAGASARRAGRVGPLAALREAAIDDRPTPRSRRLAGAAFLLAAVAAGVATTRAEGANLGSYALYAAMALVAGCGLLGPVLLPPVVRLLTRPFAGGRGAIVLLVRQHTRTAPARTASVAAPVLLTVAFAVLIGGMVQTTAAFYSLNRLTAANADAVVLPDGVPGLSDAAVTAAGGVSALPTTLYDGVEPLPAAGLTAAAYPLLTVVDGALAGLDGPVEPAGTAAVALSRGFATGSGWQVGSVHEVTATDGRPLGLRVVAVVDGPAPAGILLSRAVVRAADPSALTPLVYLGRPAAPSPAGLGARELGAAAYAADSQDSEDRLVWVFTALLIAVSAGFGLLAVVNTVLMATTGRAGDLRVLRRSGATRRQVLGMLAAEAAAVVAVGAGLGLAVAVAALAALARGLGAQLGVPVPMVLPWGTLAGTVGVCLLLAVASALLPAGFGRPARWGTSEL